MRESSPGGAAPYSPAVISLSVPSTPTRRILTNTPRPWGTSSSRGLGTSRKWMLFGLPGMTQMAFMNGLLQRLACSCGSVEAATALKRSIVGPRSRGKVGGAALSAGKRPRRRCPYSQRPAFNAARSKTGFLPADRGRVVTQGRRFGGHSSRHAKQFAGSHPGAREGAASLLPALFDEFGDKRSPTGLMAGSNADARVTLKILVEQKQIAPVRIRLENLQVAKSGAAAVTRAQEKVGQAVRKVPRHLPQWYGGSRAGGQLDFQTVPEVVVKLLQRFDQQEIHREPHRPAPVRVPAEETGGGLSRLVVHTVFVAIDMQHIGVFAVMLGKRSNAVRGEKLVLVQHVAEHAHELPAVYQREQAAHATRPPLGHFHVG